MPPARPVRRACLVAGAVTVTVLAPPAPSSPVVAHSASSACNTTYTVQPGDSWYGIAARAGVAPRVLVRANGTNVARQLHPGDELCLPAGVSVAAAATRQHTGLQALPVQGPCWYADTWQDARGGGRRHEGVDLVTWEGRYVYAVVDGTLTRRVWDVPGRRSGNAWWLTAADGSGTYYFYAHLRDFAPGLSVGSRVRAGQIIGFVGNTGNSATAHLHFEIHPNGGPAVNPYPAVKAAGGCRTGRGYTQPDGWTPPSQ